LQPTSLSSALFLALSIRSRSLTWIIWKVIKRNGKFLKLLLFLDASAGIAESSAACANWLYKYDGCDPPASFISENAELFTPLTGLLAARTEETFAKFDFESDDLPSLDELGIKSNSLSRSNSTSKDAKVFEKVERPRNIVKTEVDDFYRSLMSGEGTAKYLSIRILLDFNRK